MAYEAQRVAQGAALLDRVEPGWWDRIDLGELELNSGCRCVCGQLGNFSDDFYHGYVEMLFGQDWPNSDGAISAAHGFFRDSAKVVTPDQEFEHPALEELNSQYAIGVLTDSGRRALVNIVYAADSDAERAEYARLGTLWTEAILRRRARDTYEAAGRVAVIVDETLVVDGHTTSVPVPAGAVPAGDPA